jgi:hypothetical protein
MMHRNNVCPSVSLLTDNDARDLIAPSLIAMCADDGPSRVGLDVGCDEKTIRRARDKETTLKLSTALNLLARDPHALDKALAHFGRRSVPVEAKCDSDALPAMTGAVHKLVLATDERSPAGRSLHRDELLDAEPDLLAAFDAIGTLLQRIDRIKKGEAA